MVAQIVGMGPDLFRDLENDSETREHELNQRASEILQQL